MTANSEAVGEVTHTLATLLRKLPLHFLTVRVFTVPLPASRLLQTAHCASQCSKRSLQNIFVVLVNLTGDDGLTSGTLSGSIKNSSERERLVIVVPQHCLFPK